MQIKKFIAPTLKEASAKMKNEIGDEAVILGTRIVYDHGKGSQKMFEITAGIEETEEVPEYAGKPDFNYETDKSDNQEFAKTALSASGNYAVQNRRALPQELRRLSEKIFINPAAGTDTYRVKMPLEKQDKFRPATINNIEKELKEIDAT